ncbi:MAG: pili assembly chaperone [Acidobacteria bacterium]|nr:MAG: pili assembly chaperone [Acidobacteriota bacterium]
MKQSSAVDIGHSALTREAQEKPAVGIGRSALTREAQPSERNGFTLLELLLVVAIIAAIAAIATPGLLRARISANEASAIASLRAIGSAQATFSRSCANGLYAASLDILGTGPSGDTPFISVDLGGSATASKSGYLISLAGATATLATGFHSWADPVSSNSGIRYFGSNTTGTIWHATSSLSGMSDTASPSGGTPIQ